MTRALLAFLCFSFVLTGAFAQRNCGSMDVLQQQIEADPARQQRLDQIEQYTRDYLKQAPEKAVVDGIIVIPVIVHVVYNNATENISDAQIASQIQVLNDDFRRLNADATNTPTDFVGVAADTEIEFCLTQTIRVAAGQTSFGTNDSVKSSSSGGSDAVTPTQAMNFWVCNIGGGILGYAQFPGGPAATDGIVVDYRYFGTIGTATAPFNLGRTATHEVGHYLNLRHIWGDGGCNVDDFVSDTPTAGGPNYTGSPCTYPGPNSCGAGRGNKPGDGIFDMFQNYMDYSDDGCMNIFTSGQKSRMWAAINASRPGLLTGACDGTPPPPPTDPEICDNGIDDDGDGFVDCADGDCGSDPACAPTGACPAPANLTHTRQKGGREALLEWDAVAEAQSYFVEVYTGGGSLYASGPVASTGAIVGGLTKNAPYTWRVRSDCAGGVQSDWADGAFNARQANSGSRAFIPEVAVYPNPTDLDLVRLNWDLATATQPGIFALGEVKVDQGPVSIRVHDLTGRALIERTAAAGTTNAELDISRLATGVYLVRITDQDGYTASTKLIKL